MGKYNYFADIYEIGYNLRQEDKMPKQANPIPKIKKAITSLKTKLEKINGDIEALESLVNGMVDAEPIITVAAPKKTVTKKTQDEPKRRGRPPKAK